MKCIIFSDSASDTDFPAIKILNVTLIAPAKSYEYTSRLRLKIQQFIAVHFATNDGPIFVLFITQLNNSPDHSTLP